MEHADADDRLELDEITVHDGFKAVSPSRRRGDLKRDGIIGSGETMKDRPNLGISACLLGEKVRYDGGHRLDRYLKDVLGAYVNWIPVCPEVECGMTVPREIMRLTGNPDSPRLVTLSSGTDQTERMMNWTKKRLNNLEKQNLVGFVFKARSPSCGMRAVKVYNGLGFPQKKGIGLFADAFTLRFPLIPVDEEGRLADPALRENFIERVFVYRRWKDLEKRRFTATGLREFHADHKFLVMAHHPRNLRELGRIAAKASDSSLESAARRYSEKLMATMKYSATVRRNVNALLHTAGYLKKLLTPDEKQELLEAIESYQRTLVPLSVPITLVRHYARKFNEPYLGRQIYLNPHPIEWMLRNRV
jgi:uncharacterized protein YbgA (DUF1722 family)/uncharacterized protein YbbK (DUF523 family)